MDKFEIEPLTYELYPQPSYQRPSLEEGILSCILQKPELLDTIKLTSEDFVTHSKFYNFLLKCYKKFNCIDPILITSMLKGNDRYKFINVYTQLILLEPSIKNFDKYCEQLKQYNIENAENYNTARCVKSISDLTIKLNRDEISIEEFKKRVDEV